MDAGLEEYIQAPPKGYLEQVETTIDAAMEMFVFDVYAALVNDYRNVILNIGIIYVIFYVLAVYRGTHKQTTKEMMSGVIKLIIYFGLLYKYDSFLDLLYSAMTVWPEEIISTIIGTMTNVSEAKDQDSVKNIMELYFDQGWKVGIMALEKGSITDPMPWAFGIVAIIITFFLTVTPLSMAMVSKVGIAVLLGLTPIFLVFMLFGKTVGFFDGWLKSLMTLVFLKILAFSTMTISLFLLKAPFTELTKNAAAGDIKIAHFIGLFVIAYILKDFYKALGGIASALGNGFVLQATEMAGPTDIMQKATSTLLAPHQAGQKIGQMALNMVK